MSQVKQYMEIASKKNAICYMVRCLAPVRMDMGRLQDFYHVAARHRAAPPIGINKRRPEFGLTLSNPDRAKCLESRIEHAAGVELVAVNFCRRPLKNEVTGLPWSMGDVSKIPEKSKGCTGVLVAILSVEN